MSATDSVGITYWTGTDLASIHKASAAQELSLMPKVQSAHTSTGNRDTATAAMRTAGKKGLLAWVDALGQWVWDGTTWQRIPVKGVTYTTGVYDGNTDGNGLVSIDHGLGTASITVTFSPMHAGNDLVTYVTKPHLQEIQSTFFVVRFMDIRFNPPTPMNSNAVKLHWRAEKL